VRRSQALYRRPQAAVEFGLEQRHTGSRRTFRDPRASPPLPSIAAVPGTNQEHEGAPATDPQSCYQPASRIPRWTSSDLGSKFNRVRDIPPVRRTFCPLVTNVRPPACSGHRPHRQRAKGAGSASVERATETIASFAIGLACLAARTSGNARPQMRLHHDRIASDGTAQHRNGLWNGRAGLVPIPCAQTDADQGRCLVI
jgi:hypothetical protein